MSVFNWFTYMNKNQMVNLFMFAKLHTVSIPRGNVCFN